MHGFFEDLWWMDVSETTGLRIEFLSKIIKFLKKAMEFLKKSHNFEEKPRYLCQVFNFWPLRLTRKVELTPK